MSPIPLQVRLYKCTAATEGLLIRYAGTPFQQIPILLLTAKIDDSSVYLRCHNRARSRDPEYVVQEMDCNYMDLYLKSLYYFGTGRGVCSANAKLYSKSSDAVSVTFDIAKYNLGVIVEAFSFVSM